MRYVEARIKQESREEAYRIFVTKSLQLVPQNKFINISYLDLFETKQIDDKKTGDEIAVDIIQRAGLSFEV